MIKLDKDYSDYTDDTDEAYPAGKAVDATTEESIDGTPYLEKWMNNTHGAFTALWVKALGSVEGMSGEPDSVAHSDVLLAVEKLIELPLTAHSDTLGATSAATEGQIVARDQVGRAKVAAPVAVDDIAQFQQVIAEAEARASADGGLQNQITTEAQTRANADDELGDTIDAEAKSRVAADTTEENARVSADSGLSGRITAEATARLNADNALSGRISTETNARVAADTNLQNSINILNGQTIVASSYNGTSGYIRYANNLKMQWGILQANYGYITYPIAFLHQPIINVFANASSVGHTLHSIVLERHLTGARVCLGENGAAERYEGGYWHHWIALGI